MHLTPTITLRGIGPSAALETDIRARVGKLATFQKSSVLKNVFDRLTIGSTVSFVEEAGENGPQASTVKLLHPRRARRFSRWNAHQSSTDRRMP